MPPKKEKKDERAPAVEEPEVEDGAREIQERELVISHLKSALGAFQDRGAALEHENSALVEAINDERQNLRDINEYLTNELRAKEMAMEQLKSLVATYEADIKAEGEAFDAKVAAGKQANVEELARLKEALAVFHSDIDEIQRRREDKARILTGIKRVSEMLFNEQRDHELHVNDQERLAVQEKDRLKKEMALKIKETNLSLMKLTDNQLEITTKRTIMENEQMSADLATVSRSTEKLINKNDDLIKEHSALRISLELSKQMGADLEKRSRAYQRTIKSLLHRLKENEERRRLSERDRDRRHEDIEGAIDDMSKLQIEIADRYAELDHIVMEREDAFADLDAFRASQNETSSFLIRCLAEVKDQIITVVEEESYDNGALSRDSPSPESPRVENREGSGTNGANGQEKDNVRIIRGQLEELSVEQRERALGYLLEKLHHHQASRQQRLLGLGQPIDGALVLPPIDKPASGALGAVTGPELGVRGFTSGGAGMVSHASTQTNDAGFIARSWEADGKAKVPGSVQGELRPWGSKLDLGPGGIRKHQHFGKRFPPASSLPVDQRSSKRVI